MLKRRKEHSKCGEWGIFDSTWATYTRDAYNVQRLRFNKLITHTRAIARELMQPEPDVCGKGIHGIILCLKFHCDLTRYLCGCHAQSKGKAETIRLGVMHAVLDIKTG
eukprot:scaffold172049_cov31-Tisochrysis_lutea.AAC.1